MARFSFKMRGFIVGALGLFTATELDLIEQSPDPWRMRDFNPETQRKASLLHYALTMKLSGPSLTLLQRCEPFNGIEAWRKVCKRWDHTDAGAAAGRLGSILRFNFTSVDFQEYLN